MGQPRPVIKPDLTKSANPSVSAKGLEEIRKLRAIDAPEIVIKEIRRVMVATADDPKFDPFSAEQHQESLQQYAADVRDIQALPKVQFLQPKPGA